MNHKIHLVALTGLLGLSGSIEAATTTVSSPFTLSATQVDTNLTSTPTASYNVFPTGQPTLGQFDPNLGVLTGVNLTLNSTRTQTVGGSASKGMGPARTAYFVGSSTAALSGPGFSPQTFASIAANTSCNLPMGMGPYTCTPPTGTSGSVATNASLAVSSLDSYVGSGNVGGIALTLPVISADIYGSNTLSGGSATTTLNWAGSLSATYTYLLHAAPSFDGNSSLTTLTLNFGTVSQGASVAPLSFSIFNLTDSDRVGLDLDSVVGLGDTGHLYTNLAPFSNLTQGNSLSFNAFLDTSSVGSFSAQYLINLSDADVGAQSSRWNYQLTLNLAATVVPLPATVWLFSSVLAAMVFIGDWRHKLTV